MARKRNLLTRKEVVELIEKAHAGDITARNTVIERNMGLIYRTAQKIKFNPSALEREDLHQVGVLGLIRAIEKFDASRGYQFSTYATWWIRQAMQRHIEKAGSLIARPTHVHHNLMKVKKTSEQLFVRYERDPTIEEISRESGLKERYIEKLLSSQACNTLSLEDPISEESTIEDLVYHEGFERHLQLKLYVEHLLRPKDAGGVLNERERIIVQEIFLNGKSSRDLQNDTRIFGKKKAISRQHICSILNRALSKLKTIIIT